MEEHPALQQRKSGLSIGTPFDPFYFIDKTFDHSVAPCQAATVGNRFRIVGESINKSDQFRDPTGLDSSFPLLQTQPSLAFSRDASQSPAQD
jgi:hypothetical protein